jgi:hypothetical protein
VRTKDSQITLRDSDPLMAKENNEKGKERIRE